MWEPTVESLSKQRQETRERLSYKVIIKISDLFQLFTFWILVF